MFDPIKTYEDIKNEYTDYIDTTFHIANEAYEEGFSAALREPGVVSKGPYLEISNSYATGKSLDDLIDEGIISGEFRKLNDNEIHLTRPLYRHQEEAIRKINAGNNVIVTTGTGSGKTECFLYPIIDYLLKEKERGELGPGVRAILIYPMNALANDQMSRLRALLENYRDITFGVYNGNTSYDEKDGRDEYEKLYGKPALENEMFSRHRMQETPPHILVTNYAMLEYMMLRPKDDGIFSKSKLRFIVLDEAHIYRGATGMETSLLLSRLKARIPKAGKVLSILTSATLGDESRNGDIVKFGKTLCGEDFDPSCIVRAEYQTPVLEKKLPDAPLEMFADLADSKEFVDDIAERYKVEIDGYSSVPEFLYDLCASSSFYRDLRDVVTYGGFASELYRSYGELPEAYPMTLDDLTAKMQERYPRAKREDVANVVRVASETSKNGMPLLKARYHTFARALDGAYITLGKYKEVYLDRQESVKIADENVKVFECAVCRDCGRLAVIGKENDNHVLEFTRDFHDEAANFYMLYDEDKDSFSTVEDDEEESGDRDPAEDMQKYDYKICSKCGKVFHASLAEHRKCDCGEEYLIDVRKVEKKDEDERKTAKCPACPRGKLGGFYLNYDAATSVLGTALYEELQREEVELQKKPDGASIHPSLGVYREKPKETSGQFLSFSDNRGEAAYFASYMSKSYEEFLRRRGMVRILEDNHETMASKPWELDVFAKRLSNLFDEKASFAKYGERESSDSGENAWVAILNEMVNAGNSESLSSLGFLKFNFKYSDVALGEIDSIAREFGRDLKEIKSLFDVLVQFPVRHGAVELEKDTKISLSKDERDYIYNTQSKSYYTAVKKRVRLLSVSGERGAKSLSWAASKYPNGNYHQNARLSLVAKALGLDKDKANELLMNLWEYVLKPAMQKDRTGDTHYLTTDNFTISAVGGDFPVYKCDVCGKISATNCNGVCPATNCPGHLKKIDYRKLQEGNRYCELYRSHLMKPLHIKEHTAQLGKKKQLDYQKDFVCKKLDALSCSTTFEIGVDLGDMDTVYLRDMPPTPANYVQRVGRAGRRMYSSGFSLTYAKLGSHDFTFYKNPEKMITGEVSAPAFSLENKKVVQRHINAVALSSFFALHPEIYDDNDADEFLNGTGWKKLCDYLNGKPDELRILLEESVPESMCETMGIDDFGWTDDLTGEDGTLTVAVKCFKDTVEYYKKEIERARRDRDPEQEVEYNKKLKDFRRGKDDGKSRNELIDFFVRNNVLPKYGFPVDTVELHQNNIASSDDKLQMVRDLQIAVSEYAPGSQVVADGKVYTSRYIRKDPSARGKGWTLSYIAKCANEDCQAWNYREVKPRQGERCECIACRKPIKFDMWEQAIEPRMGFVADEGTPPDASMKKPQREYSSDVFYIGDPQRKRLDAFEYVSDGVVIKMESTANDSLMVVCNDSFMVCPDCGYSVLDGEPVGKSSIEDGHRTPWGKICKTKLEQNKLCHVFKTDVVSIEFRTRDANYKTMLSTMYALLEGMSQHFDIERNDIDGCVHLNMDEGYPFYTIVLYDTVAGGAGHVRRLMSEDGSVFKEVAKTALERLTNHTCSPSCYYCLRNYKNQQVHDLLDKRCADAFLDLYCLNIKPKAEDSKSEP